MAPIRCCFDQTAVWHSDAARGPSTPSFNHLVGARGEAGRHLKTERLRGLEIDDQFEFARLYHRQLSSFFALEDAAGVGADPTIPPGQAGPVTHQAARDRKFPKLIDRGDGVMVGERDELLAAR